MGTISLLEVYLANDPSLERAHWQEGIDKFVSGGAVYRWKLFA